MSAIGFLLCVGFLNTQFEQQDFSSSLHPNLNCINLIQRAMLSCILFHLIVGIDK